jgi:hypothetical protein
MRVEVETEGFWFSVPNVGAFMKNCVKGRQELIAILKRQKHKELLQEVTERPPPLPIPHSQSLLSSISGPGEEEVALLFPRAAVSYPRSRGPERAGKVRALRWRKGTLVWVGCVD